MKAIYIFAIMLLSIPAASSAVESAVQESHRVMIEDEQYQLMREVCKTLHPKGLHWNGRTANLAQGYDGAVISIECQMPDVRRGRVNMDTVLDGQINICAQDNEALTKAREALLSEPGILLPTGCELGPRHVAEIRIRPLLTRFISGCHGTILNAIGEDEQRHRTCVFLYYEFNYFYGRVLGRSVRALLERGKEWKQEQLATLAAGFVGKWWLVVSLAAPESYLTPKDVVEGIERFDTGEQCGIAGNDWHQKARDWATRSRLPNWAGEVTFCVTEEEASGMKWWPRRMELPFPPR